MSGQVNASAIRQFRTPTYPLVLISTDLLQEGEDLQTFCDEVHHYGIAWMPSSLEQRTGRVDRVNSLAERRLSRSSARVGPDGRPPMEERIQVLYPYVSGTYEQLQVRRVLSRLDEHVRLLHESFGKKVAVSPRIDVDVELAAELPLSSPTTNLGEPYGIAESWLRTRRGRFPVVDSSVAAAAQRQFTALVDRDRWGGRPVTWVGRGSSRHLLAELDLGARVQPLDLRLTSSNGHAAVRVTSPVGLCSAQDVDRLLDADALPTDGARLGVVRLGPRDRRTFSVTVEDFVMIPRIGDVWRLLERRAFSVVQQADAIERSLLSGDRPLETFAADLDEEVRDGQLA